MNASGTQYLDDTLFFEMANARMSAVLAALAGLMIGQPVIAQLRAEIIAALIEQRDIAPESSRDPCS